ncbi:MAG: hypothetical protein UT18_C0009G0053 [candidate division CPR2 bacterium GW2011_GWC2_39_10]|uniref:Uncharacterized protein n=1 Tax=candidate division CPR2 bacterium GW2011_GWC2_39_10 TaxID=1618345 RepID=A0A0G0LUF6_UNCC2|nr:MAG: hypothetical protein UT18_C0009G0053 [candidate division CPR2 bacterium GW2011_GWC2_39_10]
MKRHLKLILLFMKLSLMKEMIYKKTFVWSFITITAWWLVQLTMVNLIYYNVKAIAGWNFGEMLVLLGTFNIVDSLIFAFFVNNMGKIADYIRKGDLDFFLIKPISSQFYVTFKLFSFNELYEVFLGMFLVFFGLGKISYNIPLINWSVFIIMIFSAIAISYALWLITSCFAFISPRISEIHEAFISISQFSKYPVGIYNKFFNRLLVWFFPVLFMAAIPAGVLLGKYSFIYAAFSIILAVMFILISTKIWNFSLKYYQSASS